MFFRPLDYYSKKLSMFYCIGPKLMMISTFWHEPLRQTQTELEYFTCKNISYRRCYGQFAQYQQIQAEATFAEIMCDLSHLILGIFNMTSFLLLIWRPVNRKIKSKAKSTCFLEDCTQSLRISLIPDRLS